MNSSRRRFSGELKAKVALEALRGERTLQETTADQRATPEQRIFPYLLRGLVIERLWRSLKYESICFHETADGLSARCVIRDWVVPCNAERSHPALGG